LAISYPKFRLLRIVNSTELCSKIYTIQQYEILTEYKKNKKTKTLYV